MSELQLLLFVFTLLVVEAAYSGSEIALLSADRLDLLKRGRKGSRGSQLALSLADNPERILSTTLLMTSLCAIGVSALIAIYMEIHSELRSGLASIAISSGLVIFFGEILPKTLFQRYASRLAPRSAYLITGTFFFFFPITRLLSFYTSRLSRLVGPIFELISGKRRTSRDEIQSILSYGRRDTGIASDEKRMIKRIFDFKDTEAKNALIPLVKVDAIEATATVRESLERFQQHRHSRMPVFDERVDNIIGTIRFSDLLKAPDLNGPIRPYVEKAHYASETQILEDLLVEMHREKRELTAVVDEYGGAVGILTLEDIIEEVVGEIHDEHDSKKSAYRQIDDGKWWIQARMEIEEVNEQIKIELPEGDYETLGGFLLQQFGRIPEPRDELYFDTPAGAFKFTIKQANERAIETVLVERLGEHGGNGSG